MTRGRRGKPGIYFSFQSYGSDGSNPVTTLIMTSEGQGLSPFNLNPVFPFGARAVAIGCLGNTNADIVAGNWTMRLRKNESFADSATFSFAVSTGINKTAGRWSSEVLFDAGDTFYITADGPSKNGIAVRAWLLFEPL